MGVPGDFPRNTTAFAIFSASDRLPPKSVAASANDVAKDHFLIARLDEESVNRIFSGVFANSSFENFLKNEVTKRGTSYWAVFPEVMPDGDIFVIFTLWQNLNNIWKITDVGYRMPVISLSPRPSIPPQAAVAAPSAPC
jgi:hypothetical protein